MYIHSVQIAEGAQQVVNRGPQLNFAMGPPCGFILLCLQNFVLLKLCMYLVCVYVCVCLNLPAGVLAEGLRYGHSRQQKAGPASEAGYVDHPQFTQQTGTGQTPIPGHRHTEVHCQKAVR